MDPHLSGLLVSGCSRIIRTSSIRLLENYPDWVRTVQLECLVETVHFIRVFECSLYYTYIILYIYVTESRKMVPNHT